MTNLLKRFDEQFLFHGERIGDPAIQYVNSPNIIQDTAPLKAWLTTEITTLIERLEGMKYDFAKISTDVLINEASMLQSHNLAIDKAIALLQAEIS